MVSIVEDDRHRLVRGGIVAAFIAVYVCLELLISLRKQPWSDEGTFASPAYNLAFHGFMGTTLIEERGSGLPEINRYTYWNPPVGTLLQAAALRLFGLHIVAMRGPSILMGLVAGLAWFVILRELTGRRTLARLGAMFVMTDYGFLMAASSARYDLICAGFGALGLALYLSLRERSLSLALPAATTSIVAGGLTHPMGLVYLLGLGLLLVAKDRSRLGSRTIGLATVPFLLGAGAWYLYIRRDPTAFIEQFRFNLTAGNRRHVLDSLLDPVGLLDAFRSEASERYLRAFGLRDHNPGNTGPIFLKSIILAGYAVGAIASVAIPAIRNSRGARPLLALLALAFLFLTFFEGQRGAVYLIHVLPLYGCTLAFCVWWLLYAPAGSRPTPSAPQPRATKWLVIACVSAFVALQVGGAALRAVQDTYGKRYAPAMAFVRGHAAPNDLVMGATACAFGVGLDRGLLSDNRLGYYTDKVPEWIIVEDVYNESFAMDAHHRPVIYAHIQSVLNRYEKVYDHEGFEIFRRPREDREHIEKLAAW